MQNTTAATSKALRLRRSATRKARVALATTLVAAALVVPPLVAGLVAPPAHADTTFKVTNTNDSGAGSLRQAILDANITTGTDTITFAIPQDLRDPTTGVATIAVGTPLPVIMDPLVINGYSQPGSQANTLARGTNAKPLVEITPAAGFDPGFSSVGGITVGFQNTTIKGLVINRFPGFMPGIEVSPFVSHLLVDSVKIQGNFLGTDPSGTIDEGNGGPGLILAGSSGTTVGGTTAASRNLISGNGLEGVFIRGLTLQNFGPASNNLVQGNLIGTKKDGITPLGNGADGVAMGDSATSVSGSAHDANGNSILSNSIFANAGIGIDLQDNVDGDGPSANDAGDADAGPNRMQNKPTISSAKTVSGTTTVKGTLNSRPNETYTVQFFSSPSGSQGRRFLSSRQVSTDGSGKGTFSFAPKKAIAVGQRVTATATRNNTGDTSEFSAARTVASS